MLVLSLHRLLYRAVEASAINLPPMTDLYDFDRTSSVVNRVENAVIPLPDAIDIFRE
jgi:hypothetical protein